MSSWFTEEQDDQEYDKKKNKTDGIKILVSNYSGAMNVDSVLSVIQSRVEQNTHLNLDVNDYFIDEDGVSIIVKNEIQAEAVFALNGIQIGTKHLWISNYPEKHLIKHIKGISSLFAENFKPNFTMDLSNFQKKYHQSYSGDDFSSDKKKKKFDLNDDKCMEFLFFRLGTEAKQNNTIIKRLVLCKNNLTHISNIDRLLWFLPGLLEINLKNNPLVAIPDLKGFSHIRMLTDFTKEEKQKDKESFFGNWS